MFYPARTTVSRYKDCETVDVTCMAVSGGRGLVLPLTVPTPGAG